MVCLLALLGTAAAQDMPAGWDYSIDVERFKPASDHYGYTVTESAATLKHLQVGVGLWGNYAEDEVSFYLDNTRARLWEDELATTLVSDDGDGVVDRRSYANLQFGMGISQYFSFSVDMPVLLWQEGYEPANLRDPANFDNELVSSGPGDLRITPKAVVLNRDEFPVGIAVLARITAPTGKPISFIGEGDPTFTPMLAIEASDKPIHGREYIIRAAGNIGYKVRTDAVYGDLVIGNELVWAAAVELHPHEILSLGADIAGATTGDVRTNPIEVIPWLQFGAYDLFTVRGGVGLSLSPGLGAPDYRIFGGATLAPSFNPKDLDRDKDGIQNNQDQCPNVPEDLDGFQDEDGCPEDDNDNDGYKDPVDSCPMEPEDFDNFEDEDGCPEPDNDGDGILDATDRCPLIPENFNNFQDDDGCPDDAPVLDSDKDGLTDNIDRCPYDPEDYDRFEDDDGCPDPDNDQDGIIDGVDACPLDPEDIDQFEDYDGCPEWDNDRDTIVDRDDACPDVPENFNNFEDADGCPDEAPPRLVVVQKQQIIIYDKVYFEFDSDQIKPVSYPLLDEVVSVVLDHPHLTRIRIEGHTDSSGDDAYNLGLSQRRADSVMAYLIGGGIAPGRLTAQGLGELKPIADNDTEEGKAENRRVEFHIVERDD